MALEIPHIARSALVRWRGEQLGEVDGLRRLDPSQLHVTLCFLGPRSLRDVAAIGATCRRFEDQAPLPLSFGRAMWLPRGRPRVLAIELADRRRGLAHLQAELAQALADGGWYAPERRKFLAHVTLARAGRDAAVPELELPPPAPIGFRGTDLTLFRSHLGAAAGARYERLATVRLAGE